MWDRNKHILYTGNEVTRMVGVVDKKKWLDDIRPATEKFRPQ